VWPRQGCDVHVKAHILREGEEAGIVITVDLWVERPHADPAAIDAATSALELIVSEIERQLDPTGRLRVWPVLRQQEFAILRLRGSSRRTLANGRARNVLGALMAPSNDDSADLPSVRLDGGTLCVGPEPEGAIEAVKTLLRQEQSADSASAPTGRAEISRYWWIVPIAIAMAMLCAWRLSISGFSISCYFALLTVLLGVSLSPAPKFGWRQWLARPPVAATIGFAGTGLFGLGYALCWLFDHHSLQDANSLGYAFLASLGIGIAGGVIGDHAPAGAARVLAHVQLLLYLGGVAGIIALLLNIQRATAPRGE
jgi:hypothetical protein